MCKISLNWIPDFLVSLKHLSGTLNWSTEVIVLSISIIPLIVNFIIMLYNYRKEKYQYVLVLMLMVFFYVIYFTFETLSKLYLSKLLFILSIFTTIPALILVVIFYDLLNREYIDPKKIAIIFTLASAEFFTAFFPNPFVFFIYPNGELGMIISGSFQISIFIFISVVFIEIFYYSKKFYTNIPKGAKLHALINIIGMIFLYLSVIFIIGLNRIVPGGDNLFTGIGWFFITLSFVYKPKLAYSLSFQRLHHIYFYVSDGSCIYDHSIRLKEDVQPQLVSGGLTGIGFVIQEITKSKADVEIIKQKNMTILLEHGKYVSAALITEANHIFLRNNLKKLVQEVEENFQKELKEYSGNITPFSKIGEFVQKIFEA